MEPYESIYVGNFIFTLGYLTREKGIDLSSQGAALMTQNVGDEVLADLISSWAGKNFIIEFKRNEQSVKSEFGKAHKKNLLQHLEEHRASKVLASRGHFISYGNIEPNDDKAELYFSQYHKLQDSVHQTSERVTLSKFIFNIVMNEEWGLTERELKRYIDILASSFNSSDSSSSGSSTLVKAKTAKEMSSLVINYNAETSQINFVTCDLSRARELVLELKPKRVREIKRQITRGYDDGPSFGM